MAEVKTAYRQFLGGFLGCPLTVIQVWTQIKPAQISAVTDLVTDHNFAFLMQLKVDLTWLMVWCLEISKVDLAMQTKSIAMLWPLQENFWMKKKKKKDFFVHCWAVDYPVLVYSFHKRVLPPWDKVVLSLVKEKHACFTPVLLWGWFFLFSWRDFFPLSE